MPDPFNHAGLANEECCGNTVLASSLHPVVGHPSFIVDGHGVGHGAIFGFDEITNLLFPSLLRFLTLPDGGTHEGDAVLAVVLLHLGQMWDLRDAGTAPCCPEFHDISLAWLKVLHRRAIEVFGDLDGGGLVADGQGRFGILSHGGCGEAAGQSGGKGDQSVHL